MVKNKSNSGNSTRYMAIRLMFLPVIVSLLSFFIYFSVTMLSVSAWSKEIGYTVYSKDESGKFSVREYYHSYSDGKDKKIDKYDENEIYKFVDRQLSESTKTKVNIFTQALTFIGFVFIIYNYLHPIGLGDRTRISFCNEKGDPNRGYKAGLYASIPQLVLILLIIAEKIFKTKFALPVFRLINFTFYYIFELIVGDSVYGYQCNLFSIILLLLIPAVLPVAAGISYKMGFKEIVIKDKLMYSKKTEKK